MKQNNKKCIVCGTVYTYCPACAEYDHLPKWHNIFHEENCKNIYDIVCDYDAGVMDKETAMIALAGCDLSNKDNLHHVLAETIDEINGTKKKSKNS